MPASVSPVSMAQASSAPQLSGVSSALGELARQIEAAERGGNDLVTCLHAVLANGRTQVQPDEPGLLAGCPLEETILSLAQRVAMVSWQLGELRMALRV